MRQTRDGAIAVTGRALGGARSDADRHDGIVDKTWVGMRQKINKTVLVEGKQKEGWFITGTKREKKDLPDPYSGRTV
jgi:hypothetical protein